MPHISIHHAKMHSTNPALLNAAPLPTLLIFAVPIILGNIFQQLYSIIDAIVIGKFLGNLSLAGISVANPITDVANAVIIGGSIGIGVLAANIAGAEDMPRLKRTHSTALIAGLAISILLAAISCAAARYIIIAQGTDENVCSEALRYLYVVLGGLPFCFLYNYYGSMLRSLGDSKTPFYILLLSSLLHAGLDYILVAIYGLGIGAVAFSTLFCQAFSSALCIISYHRNYAELALGKKDFIFSFNICKTVLSFAWAAALQQAVVCAGRLLVQGTLTYLGADTVTGYNMGMRSEAFIFCFSQGISAALAICVSQSLGHGNKERVRRFYFCSCSVVAVMAVAIGFMLKFNAAAIIRIFSDSESVISSGAEFVSTMSFFYILAYLDETTQAFFRGIGRLKITVVFSLGQMGTRVILSYLLVPTYGIPGICFAVVVGWLIQFIIESSYGLYTAFKLKSKPLTQ